MSVSVVVVGFGAEPGLGECLHAITRQLEDGDEVVLIDNGIQPSRTIGGGVRVVVSPGNGGFGAGCALGVAATSGDVLVFVNSDAVLHAGALRALAAACRTPDVGMATGCLLLAGEDEVVNSIGNPVHVNGLSWSGGYGEAFSGHRVARDVTSVSGALFAMRREVWEGLGGLDPDYFLYHEDVDLSLRCWLAGLRVTYEPDAVAEHTYDFAKNPGKLFLLERNRAVTVLTDYPRGLLLKAFPVLVLTEPLMLLIALRDGWGREKARAWVWVLRNLRVIASRRGRVQAGVRVSGALDHRLVPAFEQSQVRRPAGMDVLNGILARYWQLVSGEALATSAPPLRTARSGT